MTQEDYIKLRNENRVDEIIYHYYKKGGGTHSIEDVLRSNALYFMNRESFLKETDAQNKVVLISNNEKVIKVEPQ